jgi:hypothetical protein
VAQAESLRGTLFLGDIYCSQPNSPGGWRAILQNFTKTLQKKTAISAEIPKFAGRWEHSRFEWVQKKNKLIMDRNDHLGVK